MFKIVLVIVLLLIIVVGTYFWFTRACSDPEAYYLKMYPDVAANIAAGGEPNGYTHWVKYGKAEGRKSCW